MIWSVPRPCVTSMTMPAVTATGEQAGYQRDDNGGALRIMGAGLAQFIDRIGSSVRSIGHDFARLARGGNGIDHAGHRRIGLGFGCLIGLIIRSVIVIAGRRGDCSFSPEAVSMF